MTTERDDFELERGTGNVFADTGLPDADDGSNRYIGP